ncbi:MAG: signal peptide peptidase SppA [Chlorobium sp.]|nr:signal peptide peptidase SppA [Chlorobium sp.]MCW8815136.1 signal peptide peptidase SppA [Chlorobium sp.]MCW8820045.1 signal peptide peptidase SppA [Ignavibacteriaceae bacterium]
MQKKKIGAGKIGCIVVVVVFLVMVIGIYRLFNDRKALPEDFVLKINLSGDIAETTGTGFELPFQSGSNELSLQDIMFLLERAGEDNRVRSVLLDIGGLQTASAKIQQLQLAIEQARKAGKTVNAFLRNAGDQDVWLASACDTITAERGNFLMLDGLKAELLFYTGTLEKIGVSFQAAQWSAWKSAVEPYTRLDASPETRGQIAMMLDAVYDAYTGYVSEKRGIARETYEGVIDTMTVLTGERAKKLNIVDEVSGHWEYLEKVRYSFGEDDEKEYDDVLVGGARYKAALAGGFVPEKKESIAVITASGLIVRSSDDVMAGTEQSFDEETLRSSVQAALDDQSVKAIVLRIDSPGGDALASVNMLQILDSAKVKKPIVASMSSVAASGGYMIALAADTVFAEPLSLTGSIGVYALKPEISKLQEKIGLKREVFTRGDNADAFTVFKPLDEAGFAKFMETTGWIYNDFLSKVARSRKMTREEVEDVAGGRVWTGEMAVKNGLVDRIGGLKEAVSAAQRMAGMDSSAVPGLKFYPQPQGLMEYLMSGGPAFSSRSFGRALPSGTLADHSLRTLDLLLRLEQQPGGMYRMTMLPYEMAIE